MSTEQTISQAVRIATSGTKIRGLRRRSVVAISVLVALVLAAQSTVLAFFGARHLRQEIEERARSFATLAVGPACDAYQIYFASGLSKFREIVLELTALNPDLDRFEIYDVQKELLFHWDRFEADAGRSDPGSEEAVDGRLGNALRGLEQVSWVEASAAGEERYVVVAPRVEEWGRHRYSVAFRFSYHGLEQARRGALWQLAGLALFALALGVVFAYLLSAQSLVPVDRLTQGARRLAEGDLHHRIGLRTGDEFEILSVTLDQMAARLASTIDDLEASNERLIRLNEELREIGRVKSDLLANVSHELRTPLTAISGYVEAMREGILGELDEVQDRSLEAVERNVKRLRGMIDQLLSYSRMESDTLEIELAPFDLGMVLRQVMESVSAAGPGDEKLDIRLDCPEDLPEAYGDAGRIAQVVENLLTNACKFSPSGAEVEILVREVAQGVEVAVRDRGIGIPAELLEKIFDRFYQIDATAKRHFGGIGLGLAIVREILELNHSEIRVESRPGQGSTFSFTLPVATDRTGKLQLGDPAERQLHGRRRIVIIDDDGGFVGEVAAHLSGRGFVVDVAATASQGFALVRRVRPEAIVLDRLLPDEDGFDLLARFREHEATRHIPVVLATVRPEKALGMRLGAAAYLRKPLASSELERILNELLTESEEEAGASAREAVADH